MLPRDTPAAFGARPAALASTRCAPTIALTTTDTSHQRTRRLSAVVEEKESHHALIS